MGKHNFSETNAAARYYGDEDSGQFDPRAQQVVLEVGNSPKEVEAAQEHPYYNTLKELGLSVQVIALQCKRWKGEVRTLSVDVNAQSGVVYESFRR